LYTITWTTPIEIYQVLKLNDFPEFGAGTSLKKKNSQTKLYESIADEKSSRIRDSQG